MVGRKHFDDEEEEQVVMADDTNNARAQGPQPNPALRTLDRLVGTWDVSGPDIRGQVTFEWMEGGFFFVQHIDLDHGGHRIKGTEYIGYEESNGVLKSYVFSNQGPGPFGGSPSSTCGR